MKQRVQRRLRLLYRHACPADGRRRLSRSLIFLRSYYTFLSKSNFQLLHVRFSNLHCKTNRGIFVECELKLVSVQNTVASNF